MLFYICPLCIDYFFARPDYLPDRLVGFRNSSHNELTRCIYDIIIIISQFVFLKYIYTLSDCRVNSSSRLSNRLLYKMSICGMLLPIFLTLLITHDISYLYSYQWREIGYKFIPDNYSYIEKSSYIGVSSCIILLFSTYRKNKIIKLVAILCLLMTICAEGKRAIIFFTLVNIAVLFFYRYLINTSSNIKASKILVIFLISLVAVDLMIEMTFTVKIERGYSDDISELVETTRIDFLRDDRARMAIFSEIYPERMKTLDYYGQTMINNLTNIFPIDAIIGFTGGKVDDTYQYYTTKALVGSDVDRDFAFMTPSIFAEFISNFGIILGSILFIILTCWFMKISTRFTYPCNFYIVMSYCLINLFSFSYIVIYLEFTFFLCALDKLNFRNIRRILRRGIVPE